ncbi:TetR/AcrR family transcriptional regulator [Effusibacillus consociatus]|uniref:TetR/AcrR family transcriptional regulator n=1 Tax=Effusibacillus consociatus TaxID=1117041 RepID=A0ABV9Q401_9BACL
MKEKIVEQSIELFETKGFSETSIQDVVDSLGVTKGTFYYYFDSKEQLLMDIQTMYIDELLKKQQQILVHRSKDCKTKVFENVQLILKQIKTHGGIAKIFFREMRNLHPDHVMVIKQKREQFRLNLQKVIETGIQNKEFRQDLRADLVTFAILGMCNWSYHWFNPNGPASDDELTKTYIEIFLNGMKSEL